MELQEKESTGLKKLQWFLLVVLIPMLFAVIVALGLLTFAGINIVDAAKKYGEHIPGFSKLVAGEETAINLEEKLRNDIVDLEAINKEQLTTISELEIEIDRSQAEVNSLLSKVEQLTEQLNSNEEQEGVKEQSFKEIAGAYESMSAKNAAAIITELQEREALKILQTLSTDSLSSILEKMDPVDAAKYTELLSLTAAP
jgi:flagellar protein FlbB